MQPRLAASAGDFATPQAIRSVQWILCVSAHRGIGRRRSRSNFPPRYADELLPTLTRTASDNKTVWVFRGSAERQRHAQRALDCVHRPAARLAIDPVSPTSERDTVRHVIPFKARAVRRRLLSVLVVGCMASSLPAFAAPPTTSDVEKLIRKGNELRKSGRSHEALPLFQKAYEVSTTPRTAAQLGLCEMALGYWLASDTHLNEALAGRGEWLESNRPTIEASLREVQRQIGEVVVMGNPTGAFVSVNGRQIGTLPVAPLRVAAGQIRVELTAPGYKDRSVTVVVVGGTQERVTIQLVREGGLPEPLRSATNQPLSGTQAGGTEQGSGSRDKSPPWSPGKIAGATMIGVGAVAALGGAALLLFDKHPGCDVQMPTDQCDERTQTRVPGWTLIGIGVAASVVGGILVYNSGSTQATVGIGPSSLVLSGRF